MEPTYPLDRIRSLWQDVYRLSFRGVRVYLKVQMNAAGHAVVVSFKEDTG